MYFILGILFMLFLITAMIFYQAVATSLIPLFFRSGHADKFKSRLSRALFLLMMDIKDDIFSHLETICEPDGDEPFEPFTDSPLRTCPPTEYINSPPKQEAVINENNNESDANNNRPRRRIARGRRGAAAIVQQLPPPLHELQDDNANPASPPPHPVGAAMVLVERLPVLPQNLIQVARQREEFRNRVGPRRVIQLRELEGLLSPPPQQNENQRGAFQF